MRAAVVKKIIFVTCLDILFKKNLELKKNFLLNVYLCIILDIIGMMSYLLPAIGETTDIIWAPVSAVIFYFLFGKKKFALLGGIFSFLEEISPGFDFIPTFTIAWFIKKRKFEKAS